MSRNILARRHLPILTAFATSNVLLAFDYDGTLAPIAATPSAARMRRQTRRLLAQVAQRYPCVVISGRPLDDLRRRLRGIPLWHLVGDHGLDRSGSSAGPSRQVDEWVERLRQTLPPRGGLVIEQKKFSVTVHYRHVRHKEPVLAAIDDAVRQLTGARAVPGAKAVNVLPDVGVHKGVALQQARLAFACDTAVYVGDDDTDEDAFRSASADRLLAIRIGTGRPSAARFSIKAQRDVDALLQALLRCRTPAASRRHTAPARAV